MPTGNTRQLLVWYSDTHWNSSYSASTFHLTSKQINRLVSTASHFVCMCAQRKNAGLLYAHLLCVKSCVKVSSQHMHWLVLDESIGGMEALVTKISMWAYVGILKVFGYVLSYFRSLCFLYPRKKIIWHTGVIFVNMVE